MACNPNIKRILVNLDGNWRDFQPDRLACYEMLGVVSRGTDAPGALAKNLNTGEYVQLNNGVETFLLQKKVIAAISFNKKEF